MNLSHQMNQTSTTRQILTTTPLNLFEKMFEPLIDQSRNITIRYHFKENQLQNKHVGSIAVCSVNESSNPEDFRDMLSTLAEASLSLVDDFIQTIELSQIDPHIDYMIEKLDVLAALVSDERYFLPDGPDGACQYSQYKTFTKYRLVGPDIGDCRFFGQAICMKAEKFSEAWLQVIQGTRDQLNLIRNIRKNILTDERERSSQGKSFVRNFILKFNLSVSQIGYLLKLFVKADIILLPNRLTPALLLWITENFQSKTRESISPSSLKNKFFLPDLASLDFWEKKLLQLLDIIREDRDRLTR